MIPLSIREGASEAENHHIGSSCDRSSDFGHFSFGVSSGLYWAFMENIQQLRFKSSNPSQSHPNRFRVWQHAEPLYYWDERAWAFHKSLDDTRAESSYKLDAPISFVGGRLRHSSLSLNWIASHYIQHCRDASSDPSLHCFSPLHMERGRGEVKNLLHPGNDMLLFR